MEEEEGDKCSFILVVYDHLIYLIDSQSLWVTGTSKNNRSRFQSLSNSWQNFLAPFRLQKVELAPVDTVNMHFGVVQNRFILQ